MSLCLKLPDGQQAAIDLLRAGGVLIFPTETVYGIGASMEHPQGLEKLSIIKQRPKNQPISVLVSDLDMALPLWELPSPQTHLLKSLGERYWPGPLTLIAPCREGISTVLTGGTGTLGIRIPQNLLLCSLIRELGGPLAAASANRAGAPPATRFIDASETLGHEVDGLIQGEDSLLGQASTVAQLLDGKIVVHREGAISNHELQTAVRAL